MRIWNYSIPSEKGVGGWASIMLREDGMFSAASDFGNYVYWWPHHGCKDFREFFLNVESEQGYFMGKLHGGKPKELNVEASFVELKKAVLALHREGDRTKGEARDVFDAIKLYERDGDWQGLLHGGTELDSYMGEAYEYAVYEYPSDLRNFVSKVMPKLATLLREELKGRPLVRQVRLLDKHALYLPEVRVPKGLRIYGTVRDVFWYPERELWGSVSAQSLEAFQEFLKGFEGSADVAIELEDGTLKCYRLKNHRITEHSVRMTLV